MKYFFPIALFLAFSSFLLGGCGEGSPDQNYDPQTEINSLKEQLVECEGDLEAQTEYAQDYVGTYRSYINKIDSLEDAIERMSEKSSLNITQGNQVRKMLAEIEHLLVQNDSISKEFKHKIQTNVVGRTLIQPIFDHLLRKQQEISRLKKKVSILFAENKGLKMKNFQVREEFGARIDKKDSLINDQGIRIDSYRNKTKDLEHKNEDNKERLLSAAQRLYQLGAAEEMQGDRLRKSARKKKGKHYRQALTYFKAALTLGGYPGVQQAVQSVEGKLAKKSK